MRLDYPDLSTPDIPYLARLLFLGLEDMPMAYLYREITTETAKALAPTEQENTPLQSLARAGRAHQRSRRPTPALARHQRFMGCFQRFHRFQCFHTLDYMWYPRRQWHDSAGIAAQWPLEEHPRPQRLIGHAAMRRDEDTGIRCIKARMYGERRTRVPV